MWKQSSIAIRLSLVMIFILAILYPLAMTGAAQMIFPRQANGSMLTSDGRTVGSELIAQPFTKAAYFHPRPSAAGKDGYDAAASGGSNLGPTSKALIDRVKKDIVSLKKENPALKNSQVPADMVTTSGSGLDPDITPASAYAQVPRVAKARAASEARIREIVAKNTTGRQFGIVGEPRVNVLKLNLALDAELGAAK